jgi:hypothetical protein
LGAVPVSQVAVLTAWVPCRGRSRFDTTVTESRNFSIGFRISLNSNPDPVVFGVQWLGRSPIGTNTAPKRRGGFAAVFAVAVSAGTMASRKGSASAVPTPRRNVRRGNDSFVMNIANLSFDYRLTDRATPGPLSRSAALIRI